MKKIIAVLLLVPPALMTAWVLYRALWLPDNHIGFDPSLFLGVAALSVISASLEQGWLRLIGWGVSAVTVGVIAGAMHFNLLLQYEDWIRLGMPEKPSWAQLGQR